VTTEGGHRGERRWWSMVTSSWRRACARGGRQREPEAAGVAAERAASLSAHALARNSSILGESESTQLRKYL
jgi:hypothetical protein